jgi:hypothetical protein
MMESVTEIKKLVFVAGKRSHSLVWRIVRRVVHLE